MTALDVWIYRWGLPRATLALLVAAAVGCTTKLDVPKDAHLSCTRDADCPHGWLCDATASLCREPGLPSNDLPAPDVVFVSPSDGAEAVAPNARIVLVTRLDAQLDSLAAVVSLRNLDADTTVPALGVGATALGNTFEVSPPLLGAYTRYELRVAAGVLPVDTIVARATQADFVTHFTTGREIDTTGPGAVTAMLVSHVATGNATLSWSFPTDADVAGALIVRRDDGPVDGLPTQGVAYAVGAPIGGGKVVGLTTEPRFADVTAPEAPAGYAVFVFDASNNYSSPRRAPYLSAVDVQWCPNVGGVEGGSVEVTASEGTAILLLGPTADVAPGTTTRLPETPFVVGSPRAIATSPSFVLGQRYFARVRVDGGEGSYVGVPFTLWASKTELSAPVGPLPVGPGGTATFYSPTYGWSQLEAQVDTDVREGIEGTWSGVVMVPFGQISAVMPLAGFFRFRLRPVVPGCADAPYTLTQEFKVGTTLYVNAASTAAAPAGSDPAQAFPTINAALAVATAGTNIFVAEGTYAEAVKLSPHVGLYGGFAADFAPPRDPTAHATRLRPPQQSPVPADATQCYPTVYADDPSITTDTVFDGFDVESIPGYCATFGDSVFWARNCAPTISHNVLHSTDGWPALFIQNGDGAVVEGNTLIDGACQDCMGLVAMGASHLVVRGNLARGSRAMQCFNGSAQIISHNRLEIRGNEAPLGDRTGFAAISCTSMTITDNDIVPLGAYGGDSHGLLLLVGSDDSLTERNRIHGGTGNSSSTGIVVDSSLNARVINNLIHGGTGSSTTGLSVSDAVALVANNTILAGTGLSRATGILASGSALVTATNNLIMTAAPEAVAFVVQSRATGRFVSLENNALVGSMVAHRDATDAALPDFPTSPACVGDAPAGGNVRLTVGAATLFASYAGADGDVDTLADDDWRLSDLAFALAAGGKNTRGDNCGGTCASPGGAPCGGVDRDFTGQAARTEPFSIGAYQR